MALTQNQRLFIKNIREELLVQGTYWNENRDSDFFQIIAPGANYSTTFMQRAKDLSRPDPDGADMENDDLDLWDLIKISFGLPDNLDILPTQEEMTDIAQNFIEEYLYDHQVNNKLQLIDSLKLNDLLKNNFQEDLLFLNAIKRDKNYLPENIQKEFDKEIEQPNFDGNESKDVSINPMIHLLKAYIEAKKGHRNKAIKMFDSIDWDRSGRTPKNNRSSSNTKLLQKIKKTVEAMNVGNNSKWGNKEFFLLITTNLKYTDTYRESMSQWLNKKSYSDINDKGLKKNIAITMEFDPKLWDNWEDDTSSMELDPEQWDDWEGDTSSTDSIIEKCVEQLKKGYKPKPIYRPSFSKPLNTYATMSDEQKSILADLTSAPNDEALREIYDLHIANFVKKRENQSFLLKAADILYEKGKYFYIKDWVLDYLYPDVKDIPTVAYLMAHIYGSGQLGEDVKENEKYYELACNQLVNVLDEFIEDNEKYADLNTSIISNDLRLLLPKLENSSIRKKNLIKFAKHYQSTFNFDNDYYPGINFAYSLSLIKISFPKTNEFEDLSVKKIHDLALKSLKGDQNSHIPVGKRHNEDTYTIQEVADTLELPTGKIIHFIKNAKQTLSNSVFRTMTKDTEINKPEYDNIVTAINSRDKRYWAYITEYEFRALRDTYDDKEELLKIFSDLQPTKDHLSRTLRQLNFYVYMLSKGNKQPNESITRLIQDLKGMIK